MLRRWRLWVSIGLSLFLIASTARSVAFDVTINTGTLAGGDGILAFDLIGSPPTNTVDLGLITTNGTPAGSTIINGVSGSGPWVFSGPSFFNELQLNYSPLGSTISFSFSTTDNPPAGSSPDGFSVFLLDSSLLPLLSTSDPTGADALFLFSIGPDAPGLEVYSSTSTDVQDFSVQVETSPTGVPEPGSLALLAVGIVALSLRRRSKR